MRVLLHCGQGKTGSTALQVALSEHRDALRRRGVCYPAGLSLHDHNAIAPLFLDDGHRYKMSTHAGARRRSDAEIEARGRAEWASILREAGEQHPALIILSHE